MCYDYHMQQKFGRIITIPHQIPKLIRNSILIRLQRGGHTKCLETAPPSTLLNVLVKPLTKAHVNLVRSVIYQLVLLVRQDSYQQDP